jgi:hypothetical protein
MVEMMVAKTVLMKVDLMDVNLVDMKGYCSVDLMVEMMV